MNTFQTVIISVFLAAAIVAVLMFAGVLPGFKNSSPENKEIRLIIWGDFDKNLAQKFFDKLKQQNKKINFVYTEKTAENFDSELINALANNEGPDLIFLPQDMLLKHKKKISPISFKNYDSRDFKDNFIDESDLFLDMQNKNIIALPFSIDPLIMYYNKTLLKNSLVISPPKTWEDFLSASKILTFKDEQDNITQAGSALGEYANISGAKDILSALFVQAGDSIVRASSLKAVLGKDDDKDLKVTEDALRFYTDFSSPEKTAYSWNKFLGSSFDNFLKGKLAIYFGFAGEFNKIKEKNPNLDFDVSVFPQASEGNLRSTFGKMRGVTIMNKVKNKEDALYAAKFLTSAESLKIFKDVFYLPSVRRDILSLKTEDSVMSIFNESAILSRGWFDPDPDKTSLVFKKMIESINNNDRNERQALNNARGEIENMLNNYKK